MNTKGLIHIYTGNGKGKTTAAFGLAIRFVGTGKNVFIAQFMKGQKYSELKTLEQLADQINIQQYGLKSFIKDVPKQIDIDAARLGLKEVSDILKQGNYDMVILDEACIAIYFKLFSVQELIEAIQNRAPQVEVIITGRNAPQELIDIADLVTEMKEIKHYYNQGVQARRGIEN